MVGSWSDGGWVGRLINNMSVSSVTSRLSGRMEYTLVAGVIWDWYCGLLE